MRAIERKRGTSLFLKIFESKQFNCIIFVYLDKDDKVISMNYHWDKETIQPKYMEFNGDGEATLLYKVFLGVMGSHSPKIYDLVIGACSLSGPKDLEISQLETKVANYELTLKETNDKLKDTNKMLGVIKELIRE